MLLEKDLRIAKDGRALDRLKEVCRGRGNTHRCLFNVPDESFRPYIRSGNILTIERDKRPSVGEYAILSHGGKYQLVLVAGKSILGNDIICVKTSNPLKVHEVNAAQYYGTVIDGMRDNLDGENLGKTITTFPQ